MKKAELEKLYGLLVKLQGDNFAKVPLHGSLAMYQAVIDTDNVMARVRSLARSESVAQPAPSR